MRWIGKTLNGEQVTLQKFHGGGFKTADYATAEWIQSNPSVVRTAAVLDVETTGLSSRSDTILELGIRRFLFNRSSGELLRAAEQVSQFQDPGTPISPEITRLTGITDAMVKGHRIDWGEVDGFLASCSLVIAHNAAFDRPFVDQKSATSRLLPWGCSLKQIEWADKGFSSKKLEILSIYHGFFTDAHRALHDADALLHLLTFPDPQNAQPYLLELLTNARKPLTRVLAIGSPFETKDLLRSRGYQWNSAEKFWQRVLPKERLNEELAWLESAVYKGNFKGQTHDIAITDHFKDTQQTR